MQRHQAQVLLLEQPRPHAGEEQQHVGCARSQAQRDGRRAARSPLARQRQEEGDEHRADRRSQQQHGREEAVELAVQRVGEPDGEALIVGQQPQQQPVERAEGQRPAPRDDPLLHGRGRVEQPVVPGRQQQVSGGLGAGGLHRLGKGRLFAGLHGLLISLLQRFGVSGKLLETCFHQFRVMIRHILKTPPNSKLIDLCCFPVPLPVPSTGL